MKDFIKPAIAALVGAAIAIGFFTVSQSGRDPRYVEIRHTQVPPVQGVTFNHGDRGNQFSLDFTKTVEAVTPSVVQISSLIKVPRVAREYRRNRLPDPFRDFFGEDFFERFYGPPATPEGDSGPESEPFHRQGSGSGVIINPNGYIVTNNHVIDQADEIEVTLADNRKFAASVVGTDPSTDLAVLKINAANIPALPLVNSDEVRVGEWVLAVGNPFNLNSTVTAGIVSAKARNINILRDRYAIESFIQTDAAINPGNSGGALVNLQGGLVGINTAIASPTGAYAGYGFAVPSNIVNKVVEDLLKYGSVQRGFLGITIRGVTADLAQKKDLKVDRGVYVDSVGQNSSAGESGIKPGDVIISVQGSSVNTAPELQEIIARHRPGDEVSITVDRSGRSMEFAVTLKGRDGQTSVQRGEHKKTLAWLGAEFETVDADFAHKLNIDGGVRITRIFPGIIKRTTRIEEGFIITHVDKKRVLSVEDLNRALDNKSGGVLLEGVYEDRKGVHYYGLGIDQSS